MSGSPFTRELKALRYVGLEAHRTARRHLLQRGLDPLHHANTNAIGGRDLVNAVLASRRALAIAASVLGDTRGRPIGLPLLVPLSRARAMPAIMRSFRIDRSSSANTPAI